MLSASEIGKIPNCLPSSASNLTSLARILPLTLSFGVLNGRLPPLGRLKASPPCFCLSYGLYLFTRHGTGMQQSLFLARVIASPIFVKIIFKAEDSIVTMAVKNESYLLY